jgi:ribonuclease P protein component
VLKTGRIFNTPYFRLRSAKNNLTISRVGIITSTKLSKKSTVRNRLRRQMREIFRLNIANIQPGFDIVLTLSPNMIGKKYGEIEQEVLKALKTVKLA